MDKNSQKGEVSQVYKEEVLRVVFKANNLNNGSSNLYYSQERNQSDLNRHIETEILLDRSGAIHDIKSYFKEIFDTLRDINNDKNQLEGGGGSGEEKVVKVSNIKQSLTTAIKKFDAEYDKFVKSKANGAQATGDSEIDVL